MNKRSLIIATAGLAGLILSGCKSDQAFQQPTRSYPANVIVSLSPSTTEVACIVDYCEFLKGRTSADNYPVPSMNSKIVVNGTTPDYEAIARMQPSFILYDATLYGPDAVTKINALGAKTLAYNPKTVKEYEDFIKDFAAQRGGETNASEYLDKVNQAISEGKGMTASGGKTVTTAFVDPGDGMLAAGTKSFWFDLMKQCGVTLEGPDSDKWAVWNAEDIVKQNPATIVTTEGGKDKINADPRFASVDAVKNKMIFEVKTDVLLRVGSRVDGLVTAIIPRMTKQPLAAVGAPVAAPGTTTAAPATDQTQPATTDAAPAGAGK